MFGFGYNKEKSRANAERYLQQNKLQNAIAEYEKILKEEPKDLAILNTVGDIYSRLGQNEKAIERFRVVGDAYAADGFTLKSIAMYKKITKLDPNGLAALEKLAELYRKQGLVSDARSTLLQAADAYTRKGQSKETLRLLKQLVLFDPENVQVITRTADLMTQSGQKNEAREMLSQTANTLVQRRALDPAQKILDRLISLDRTNLRAQELRAQVMLDLGDSEKALELYEAIPDLDSRVDGLRNLLTAYLHLGRLDDAYITCRKLITVHHDPDGVLKVATRLYKENDVLRALSLYSDYSSELLAHNKEDVLAHLHGAASRVRTNPEALQTLYNLYQRAGETSMIPEVLELLAHAAVQSGQLERARDAYKELIELEPENASHVQGYRQVCARLSPVEAAPEPAAPAPKAKPEPRNLEEFYSATEPALPLQSYTPAIEEEISIALTEAELCESFSSKTRGISFLESALQKAPEDLRLNRNLALLYRQEGATAKASICYATMQRVLEEMGEAEAASYYSNLAGSAQTTTWEASSNEFAARDFDLSATATDAGSTEEIDLSSEWDSVWQDAAPEAAPADTFKPAAPAQYPDSVTELIEEVRFCLSQQIWAEAEIALSRLASLSPTHPELPELRAQLQRSLQPADRIPADNDGFDPIEVIELDDDSILAAPSSPQASAAPPPLAPPAAPPSLSSLAAELDFELGDSFTPAPQPRREATTQAPAAAAASAHAPAPISAPRSLEPEPFVAPPVAQAAEPVLHAPALAVSAPAAPARDFLQEIATEAEHEAPAPEPSVFGDLLHDFEQGLESPEDNSDDPETHFNLGIAFREMGLLDEAIGELQKVCRATTLPPARMQQAYIWLATCFVEKGVPEASFKWFDRALSVAKDEDTRTAVNYELASAYEAAGRKADALSHFMEVYGSNIDYRDVAERIRELRSTP